uniref:Threonylcarbamoyladenosine tRNA methylthiotransferase MtaB n=1 Tax=Candidatus Kentrum sp. DK TaxID=2126562 RepID=A0A450TCP5_9GAMM|nr:MAG: threonylcarbamoyladenosine tRNA methylthiotransferase MtaB [Candidatus Kentron sp. DK]
MKPLDPIHRVAFRTLGCRINQYDTETMRTLLEETGRFRAVSPGEAADIHVVNTCSVTAQADASARKLIRRIGNGQPDARIVVTGCYAQRAPAEIAALPGVALILGTPDRAGIVRELQEMLADNIRNAHPAHPAPPPRCAVSPVSTARPFPEIPISRMMNRSRAVVKIQDGCNGACSFCIVPHTRGRSRGREPDKVIDQIARLVDNGYQEVVLAGVHLGDYGCDNDPWREAESTAGPESSPLSRLIRRILAVPGLLRFRLSSIDPGAVSPELIESMATETRFARHLHIPLQSGSDAILARMNRGYTVAQFERLLREVTDAVPDCGIGTDIICGFPGETEALFEETVARVREWPFSYLHPFPYSPRTGSPAESFPGQVPVEERKARARMLKQLSREKNLAFRRRYLGKTMGVLIESRESDPDRNTDENPINASRPAKDAECVGWTDNYLRVAVRGAGIGSGTGLRVVRITGLGEEGLTGIMDSH